METKKNYFLTGRLELAFAAMSDSSGATSGPFGRRRGP